MSSIPVEEIMRVGGFVAGTLVHTREGLQPIEKNKRGRESFHDTRFRN